MNSSAKPLVHVVVGPTASGKTTRAIELALQWNTEVINADARQVYKEMNIGVARPFPHEIEAVPHHLIAHRSIHLDYSAAAYAVEAKPLLDSLLQSHGSAVLVGGSGLYIQALLEGLDNLPTTPPEVRTHFQTIFEQEGLISLQQRVAAKDPVYFAQVDSQNPRRLLRALEVMEVSGKPYTEHLTKMKKKESLYPVLYHRLQPEREELNQRIASRVRHMIEQGLEAEVRTLYPFKHLNALKTVGYREFFDAWDGLHPSDTIEKRMIDHTRQYARRQETWFKKYAL